MSRRSRGGQRGQTERGAGRPRDGRATQKGSRKERERPETRSAPSSRIDPAEVLRIVGSRRRTLTPASILRALGLGRSATGVLRVTLSQLVRNRELERVPGGVRVPRRDGLVEGVFEVGPRGSGGGFCVREETGRCWTALRGSGSPAARAGDRVLLQPLGEGATDRGEIVHILDGWRDHWVGIYRRRGSGGIVTPYRDSADWVVLIALRDAEEAEDGDVVVAVPIGAGTRRRSERTRAGITPRGRIAAVLGRPGDAEADSRAVIWRHRLPLAFPEEVIAQVTALDEALDPQEVARRVDLRRHSFVTIDPDTARDFDDAICTEPLEDAGVRLWVAIADVAHYVPAGSALDVEALRRGNSVYFPDRVIPMLPERLSGDLCSLRPGRERLVSVVELVFDATGSLCRRSFYPAVIRSRKRLVYEDAARVMDDAGCEAEPEDASGVLIPEDVVVQLRTLAQLSLRLEKLRRDAGAIDFELPEPRIQLDAEGAVTDVVQAVRTRAHRAVEEAMLAANRAVAEALVAAGGTAIFRIHEPPDPRAASALRELFDSFGLLQGVGKGALSPKLIASVLRRVLGAPEERLVHQSALRSLRQARYSAESSGHFALAFAHYLHFTSPIRRYADLVVHRVVASLLHGDPGSAAHTTKGQGGGDLPATAARRVAGRVSWRERLAVDAERERNKLACCAVMAPHVGQEFDGTVTGVARHGLYVTLDAPFVEGLVHVSRFREFLDFDERAHTLRARRSGERFGLGNRLRVLLESVDPVEARIDFSVVGS